MDDTYVITTFTIGQCGIGTGRPMDDTYVITTFTICVTIIACIWIILRYWKQIANSYNKSKEKQLELDTSHEMAMKIIEWEQKKEWEDKINGNLQNRDYSQIEKKLEDLKEEIGKKQDKPSPLDLNRIAMLHLLLSGYKEPLSAENLDEEIKKVEKTYQLLKDKLS